MSGGQRAPQGHRIPGSGPRHLSTVPLVCCFGWPAGMWTPRHSGLPRTQSAENTPGKQHRPPGTEVASRARGLAGRPRATDTCPGLQAPPSRARASRSDLVKSARSQHLLRADGLITGTHRRLLPPIPRLLRGGNPGAASFSAAEELIHSDCRPPRDFEPFFFLFL